MRNISACWKNHSSELGAHLDHPTYSDANVGTVSKYEVSLKLSPCPSLDVQYLSIFPFDFPKY